MSRGTQGLGWSPSGFVYGALTRSGRPFQAVRLPDGFFNSVIAGPTTPIPKDWFGLFPVRSPLLGELFLFLGVLRCFSSPGSLDPAYVFSRSYSEMNRSGLPHSEIRGSAC